ncbi:MAG: 2-succinyl-6-hydroxy-2,4-cyclohexadiene-1-carboxylate synthase [Deltaproteobacteria bacterium]|nr:2-succinyl-6-hydroxy-2,4-cyclohexadiene-1-carboxylate synthase [Deltaproteobacteria bacterium]
MSAEVAAQVSGQGPPLVLLHGFTGSATAWGDVARGLARHRRVIAFDLPGHGAASIPRDPGHARLPEVAGALVRALAALGVDEADWVGYSMGARTALQVAADHPDAVRALVLESGSPGIADSVERAARAAADARLAESIERDGLERFVDAWLAQPLFASQASLPDDVRARERARRLDGRAAGYAASLRAMGTGTQEPLWERLGGVRSRTLLLAGALDVKYCAIAHAMAAALPDARVAIVRGAGHAVHLEHPDSWLDAVEPFLDGTRASAHAAAAVLSA